MGLQDGDIESLSDLLNEKTPEELADLFIAEEDNFLYYFQYLQPETARSTFALLPDALQIKLLSTLSKPQSIFLLTSLNASDRIKLIEDLPRDIVDESLKQIPHEERLLILSLLGYPEDTVGRLMTPYYVPVQLDWTVEQVLDQILAFGADSENLDYIYVVDEEGKLLDDIRLRDLLFLPKKSKISDLSDKKFAALSVYEKDEDAIQVFKKFDRASLPVIDEEGIMLGIVTIKDILKVFNEAATEDIQRFGGVKPLDEPYIQAPIFELIRKRSSWLIILFLGEGLTATVMGYFEAELARAVVLALFLPLIVSSGGNAGSQSSTLVIRALSLGEIRLRDWWKITKRELFSGVALGLILGTIGFLRVVAWGSFSNVYGEHWILIAFTVAFALLGVVLLGTIVGALFPLLLKRLGVDPAVSSAPFIATIVDVSGIAIYFLLALLILSGTLL